MKLIKLICFKTFFWRNAMQETIRSLRPYFFFESLVFILLGIAALAVPFIFTLSIGLLIGSLFLIGGLVQGFRTLKSGVHSTGFWPSLLVSILYVLVGLYLLFFPLRGAVTLTLLLAVYFFLEGIFKIFFSISARNLPQAGLVFISGLLSFLIGYIIYAALPGSASWAIGVLVGIDLLIIGITLLIITLSVPKSNERI